MSAASRSFSTAISGGGTSGLPKPRSITSSPARRSSSFSRSTSAKAYGGSASMRRNSVTQLIVPALLAGGCRLCG